MNTNIKINDSLNYDVWSAYNFKMKMLRESANTNYICVPRPKKVVKNKQLELL